MLRKPRTYPAHVEMASSTSHGLPIGKIVLSLVLLAVVAGSIFGWRKGVLLYQNFLEKSPPEIVLADPPKGMGIEPRQFSFTISDSGAGLDEVIVRATQKGEPHQLFLEHFKGERVHAKEFTVTLPGKDQSGFRPGAVALEILAFDRALWSNKATTTLNLEVDFTRPRIEALSAQHNAVHGGVELAFYRATGKAGMQHGVLWNSTLFPGYPAKDIDPAFASSADIYFAFFPIPVEFAPGDDRFMLTVRDSLGNGATDGFSYRIQKKSYVKPTIELTDDYIETKVRELARQYSESKGGTERVDLPTGNAPADIIKLFRLVNEKMRAANGAQIESILKKTAPQMLWKGVFVRPVAAKQVSQFGEERTYRYKGLDAGNSRHFGLDLAAVQKAPVVAANSGTVLYAGQLGIYGNAIIIDHGFGLSTLYAHLSLINVKEGQAVTKGAEIGRTGATGLAAGDHLHFEFRLDGVPVRPIEWWDAHWIRDHVFKKIEEVKKVAGIGLVDGAGNLDAMLGGNPE